MYLDCVAGGAGDTGGGVARGDMINRHRDVICEDLVVRGHVRKGGVEAEGGMHLLEGRGGGGVVAL